ncbi:MAG: MBL fold metallo-hydrolase [Clostridia bacterium]|nr:MBL fold metallo-hydrolase [Clostridia bacterium]
MKTYQKKNLKRFLIKLAIFMCLSALVFASLFFSQPIESVLNNTQFFVSDLFLSSKFSVHYIDVGQGDCSFIKVDDKTIMIDCGTADSAKNIIRYLNNLGLSKNSKIDYLILTHADLDHVGGACDLLDYYNFENIYRPKLYSNYEVDNNLNLHNYNVNKSKLWSMVVEKVLNETDNNFYCFDKQQFSGDNFKFSFYSPFEDALKNDNDYSPIMVLESFDKKFMFTGDASIEVENEFLSNYLTEAKQGYFDCDVLKVGHHGSEDSTSNLFLDMVNPEVCVISCGLDNIYGHPSNRVIDDISNCNGKIMRTDTMGSIIVYENNGILGLKSGVNYITSIYFEWWMFVICIEVVLAFALFIKI